MDDAQIQVEVLMQMVHPFLEWLDAHADEAMCAAVSSSLDRATLALTSNAPAVVRDGKEAVLYLRSLASQAHFFEVAALFEEMANLLAVRLIFQRLN